MIYIYGISVYEEKAGMYDSIEVNLDKNNILSAFKAVISKQEVRAEFENLLYAEVRKNPDILTKEVGEYISEAWINSCLECMPGEIRQQIINDQDVIDLVSNDLTDPIAEKIKNNTAGVKRRKLFKSFAKSNYAMVDRTFDREIYGAAMFNAAILDEAMNNIRRRDPLEVANNFIKKGCL